MFLNIFDQHGYCHFPAPRGEPPKTHIERPEAKVCFSHLTSIFNVMFVEFCEYQYPDTSSLCVGFVYADLKNWLRCTCLTVPYVGCRLVRLLFKYVQARTDIILSCPLLFYKVILYHTIVTSILLSIAVLVSKSSGLNCACNNPWFRVYT